MINSFCEQMCLINRVVFESAKCEVFGLSYDLNMALSVGPSASCKISSFYWATDLT